MARLVYATRFDVAAKDGIAGVICSYRDWIVGYYRGRRALPEFNFDPEVAGSPGSLPTSHLLSSSIFHDGDERAVRIRWSFPDDADEGLRWANEVRVGQFGDRCGVEHLISIESVEYSVAPAKLTLGSPRVVRDICKRFPTYVGQMQIGAEPYTLGQDGLNDLLALLQTDLRRLPVVFLSPYARGELNKVDPVKLARNLAGVAVVVQVENPELTWDFADEVGRQLACFNGAARIYWPGFSMDSDVRNHRLFLGAWIEQVGPVMAARAIERTIFAVAAFRYAPDSRIADLIRRTESAERQRLLVEKRETGDNFWADYERDLKQLDDAQNRVAELERENANLRANQQVFFAVGPGGSTDDLEQSDELDELSFSSVSEAVQVAATRLKNVELLGTAISAADASPFKRPYDIFKALTDLDEIVEAWRENREQKGNGGDLLQHLRDRGWGKRSSMHISSTTRGKFGSDYEFEYQGKRQPFEPHITLGSGDPNSCASIHFIFDQERLKMVVAHIGKHLPNTKR
ncbi:MAG: hypothetical protein ABF572_12325 [Gluconobacter sp.]|uniref:hypothetical protein n=1 Tax=Gluconobacter sp. TaxID=1876758 RepID=UPI0039EC57B4